MQIDRGQNFIVFLLIHKHSTVDSLRFSINHAYSLFDIPKHVLRYFVVETLRLKKLLKLSFVFHIPSGRIGNSFK